MVTGYPERFPFPGHPRPCAVGAMVESYWIDEPSKGKRCVHVPANDHSLHRDKPDGGGREAGSGVPRVASALLRQPWAKILIPVGDEEPMPPLQK